MTRNEKQIEKIKQLVAKGFGPHQISIRVVMTVERVKQLMAEHNMNVNS